MGGKMSVQHIGENTNIYFKDIPSSKKDLISAKDNLDQLLRRAPCGSICRLKITKSFLGFKGVLTITSKDKNFLVEKTKKSLAALQEELFQDISEKLAAWKKERSIDEITGVISLESLSIEKKKLPKKNN